MKKNRFIMILMILILAGNAYPQNKLGVDREQRIPDGSLGWRQNFALILHNNKDIHNINLARIFIQEQGGLISILSQSNAMLGWIPSDVANDLIGKHGIESIQYQPTKFDSDVCMDEETKLIVDYYNSAITGKISNSGDLSGNEVPLINDALEPPFINPENFFDNLKDKNLNLDREVSILEKTGVLSPGHSDTMQNTVACCLFFIESNGSIDSNLYSWTETTSGQVYNQCLQGLNFWSYQASKRGIPLTFSLYQYRPTESVTQQGYEPILHSSADDGLWINAIMANLGFYSGSKWDRVTAFNAWLKNFAGTQWSYSCFIACNPPNENAPDRFTNDRHAYAWLGGPYIQMLYKNNNWSLDDTWGTFAHESGHIFWACDEYYIENYGGCMSCAPCNNFRPVYNGNCEHPNCNPYGGVACIMKYHGNSVCSYTAQQIGWNISQYQLEIISGAGGTTVPSPGFYTYIGGDEVTVEAVPELYNCFYKWGESYQGTENPIVVTMNANKKIFADFRFINEPTNVSGKKNLNRSLFQTEYFNVLSWQNNPNNSDITIIKYKIYQIVNGVRNLLVEQDTNSLSYRHRNVPGDSSQTYEIVAINSDGREGRPATLFIQ